MKRLIPLLALTTSCHVPFIWHGSTSYSPERRADIEEAQTFMCNIIQPDDGCPPIQWDRSPQDRRPNTIVDEDSNVPDHPAEWDGRIWLPHDLPHFKRYAAHEFGHWLGLPHLPAGEMGIMSATWWDDGVMTSELMWTEDDAKNAFANRE